MGEIRHQWIMGYLGGVAHDAHQVVLQPLLVHQDLSWQVGGQRVHLRSNRLFGGGGLNEVRRRVERTKVLPECLRWSLGLATW